MDDIDDDLLIPELLNEKFYSVFHNPRNSGENGYKKVQKLSTGNRVFGKKVKKFILKGRQVKVVDIKELFSSKLKLHDYIPEVLIPEDALDEYEFKNVDFVADTNKTPMLHLECAKANFSMVRMLIDNGAKVNRKQENGNTALMEAVYEEFPANLNISRLLLNAGADINIQNNDGFTPFAIAVSRGNFKTVIQMIKMRGYGINTELRTKGGLTALILAASRGHKNMVRLIVETSKTDITAATPNGEWTAFNLSTIFSTDDCSQLLGSRIVNSGKAVSFVKRRLAAIKRNSPQPQMLMYEMVTLPSLLLLEPKVMPSQVRRKALQTLMEQTDVNMDDHDENCYQLHQLIPWIVMLASLRCSIRPIHPETQCQVVRDLFTLKVDEVLLKCISMYEEDDLMLYHFTRILGFLCFEETGRQWIEKLGNAFKRCTEIVDNKGEFCGSNKQPSHPKYTTECVQLIRDETEDDDTCRVENIGMLRDCIKRSVADKHMKELIEEEDALKRKREKKRDRRKRRQQRKQCEAKQKTGAMLFESSDESDNGEENDVDYGIFGIEEDIPKRAEDSGGEYDNNLERKESNTTTGSFSDDPPIHGPYWGHVTQQPAQASDNSYSTVTKKSTPKKAKPSAPIYNSKWKPNTPKSKQNQSTRKTQEKRILPVGMVHLTVKDKRQKRLDKKAEQKRRRDLKDKDKFAWPADNTAQGTYVPADVDKLTQSLDESMPPPKKPVTYKAFINEQMEKANNQDLEKTTPWIANRDNRDSPQDQDYGLDSVEFPKLPLVKLHVDSGGNSTLDGLKNRDLHPITLKDVGDLLKRNAASVSQQSIGENNGQASGNDGLKEGEIKKETQLDSSDPPTMLVNGKASNHGKSELKPCGYNGWSNTHEDLGHNAFTNIGQGSYHFGETPIGTLTVEHLEGDHNFMEIGSAATGGGLDSTYQNQEIFDVDKIRERCRKEAVDAIDTWYDKWHDWNAEFAKIDQTFKRNEMTTKDEIPKEKAKCIKQCTQTLKPKILEDQSTINATSVRRHHSDIEIAQFEGIDAVNMNTLEESLSHSQPNTPRPEETNLRCNAIWDTSRKSASSPTDPIKRSQFRDFTEKSSTEVPINSEQPRTAKERKQYEEVKSSHTAFDSNNKLAVQSYINFPYQVQNVYRADVDMPRFIIHVSGSEDSNSESDSDEDIYTAGEIITNQATDQPHFTSSEEYHSERETASIASSENVSVTENQLSKPSSASSLRTVADSVVSFSKPDDVLNPTLLLPLMPATGQQESGSGEASTLSKGAQASAKASTNMFQLGLPKEEQYSDKTVENASGIMKAPRFQTLDHPEAAPVNFSIPLSFPSITLSELDKQGILECTNMPKGNKNKDSDDQTTPVENGDDNFFPSMPTGSIFSHELEALFCHSLQISQKDGDPNSSTGDDSFNDVKAMIFEASSKRLSQDLLKIPACMPRVINAADLEAKLLAEAKEQLALNVPITNPSKVSIASDSSGPLENDKVVLQETGTPCPSSHDSVIKEINKAMEIKDLKSTCSKKVPMKESSKTTDINLDYMAATIRTPPGFSSNFPSVHQNIHTSARAYNLYNHIAMPKVTNPWMPRSLIWHERLKKLIATGDGMLRLRRIYVSQNAQGGLIHNHGNNVTVSLGFSFEGHEVAVKRILRTNHRAMDTWLTKVRRLQLDQRFLAKYYESAEDVYFCYLSMELCEYNLTQYMMMMNKTGRLDSHITSICHQILCGLQALHDVAVVHMNLKPTNVLIDVEGRVKLADYGLYYGRPRGHETPRQILNPCWCPTEVLNPKFQGFPYTPASDVQVAGMLLHYILTGGHHPFGDDPITCQYNIKTGSARFGQSLGILAQHLLSWMLPPDMAKRKSVSECLLHPLFWSEEKRYNFVVLVAVQMEIRDRIETPVTNEINSYSSWIGCKDWKMAVNPGILNISSAYKNTVCDLLKCIGDTERKFKQMPPSYQSSLAIPQYYFEKLYPKLFLPIYDIVYKTHWNMRLGLNQFFNRIRI